MDQETKDQVSPLGNGVERGWPSFRHLSMGSVSSVGAPPLCTSRSRPGSAAASGAVNSALLVQRAVNSALLVQLPSFSGARSLGLACWDADIARSRAISS